MRLNKKGSLEISIQAIVIVVLAMTLLGLGLGFVRGMFKTITGTTEQVSEQVRQKILDDLITGDKELSFPTTELRMDRGESQVLTVGIRNKGDTVLNYKMNFKAVSHQDQSGNINTLSPDFLQTWFLYDPTTTYILTGGQSDVRNIRVKVGPNFQLGSYFVIFEIINDDTAGIYAQKDFFVNVRG